MVRKARGLWNFEMLIRNIYDILQNPLLQLPSSIPLYFPESLRQSEISSLSKVSLVLGKARSCREPNLGCRGPESPGSPVFVDCNPYTLNVLRCSVCCRSSRTWVTFNRFLTTFEAFVPHFHLCCSHCIIPKSLLSHLNSFHGGMFKLNTKFDADSLLYLLSPFECDGHTVHMLTHWRLLPPLTSTVKVSPFTHAHSGPLTLAARLHGSHAKRSSHINIGWTFS